MTEKKIRRIEQWQDMIARLYPEALIKDDNQERILSRTVTFQVTDKCNLNCSYCYQVNKGKRRMSLEIVRYLTSEALFFQCYTMPCKHWIHIIKI